MYEFSTVDGVRVKRKSVGKRRPGEQMDDMKGETDHYLVRSGKRSGRVIYEEGASCTPLRCVLADVSRWTVAPGHVNIGVRDSSYSFIE